MGTEHVRAERSRLWIAAPALVAIGMVALYASLRSPVPAVPRAVAPPAAQITNEPSLPDPSPRTGSDAPTPSEAVDPISAAPAPSVTSTVAGSVAPPGRSPANGSDASTDESSSARQMHNSYEFFPVAANGSIESVSFTDGMTYPAPGIGQVEVRDGRGVGVDPGTGERVEVVVSTPLLHDFDRDERSEAVVEVTIVRPTGFQESTIWVFAVDDGQVVSRGRLGGSATPVGFDRPTVLTANDGVLSVDSWFGGYNTAGAVTTRTAYYELIDSMQAIDASPPRAWTRVGTQADQELRLTSDSVNAYLELDRTRADQHLRYSGRGGEVVRSSAVEGSGVALRAWYEGEQWTLIGELETGAELTLPFDGRYLFEAVYEPTATARAVLDLAVAQRRMLDAPELASVTTGRVDLDGSRTSTRFPAITHAAPHIDRVAVNALIERFALDLRDGLVAEQRAACDASDQPVLSINYETQLRSYDLVSISFDAYRSGCHESSGYDRAGLTIDLNTGEVIRLTDLADGGLAALSPALFAGLERQGFSLDEARPDARLVATEFTLAPGTARVEVDLSDFGHEYPISVWLGLDELPFEPGLAQRAASGFSAAVSEACGCY